MRSFVLRRAARADMEAVARLHRHVRKACLPYLPELHTPQQDLAFFEQHVFPASTIWLAEDEGQVIGFAVFKQDWLDHLYVDPAWHSRGVGTALLTTVRQDAAELNLWTFQENGQARRFYERHGFRAVELTDGSGNEERTPDALYRWTRNQAG
ncbi:GNAT family N-acetyltransferase [Microvirga sp. CF3062]|uniref:GNAT family N-acetyltransferase n=1 Tax=Microvirga sp. CF3062 TaxID=3110182 RepID=UPI002E79EC3C|nr:GNAT family N-acetyltransferase [Microvirga sp. CF3062]MEE1657349.1 GNAT family N-acetyltransferase [Microvirga sp. CF3062]